MEESKTPETNEMTYIQESMVNMLIRISAIEKVLVDKGILDQDNFKKAIEEVGAQVNTKLAQLYPSATATTETKPQSKE